MAERRFSEMDLREMLESAHGMRAASHFGRWTIETTHDSRPWEVIVEPDPSDRVLVVITAYMVD